MIVMSISPEDFLFSRTVASSVPGWARAIGSAIQPSATNKQGLHDLIARCIIVVRPRFARQKNVPESA
jgi:hypothetical protein